MPHFYNVYDPFSDRKRHRFARSVNDIFFGHHIVRIQGSAPGEEKQKWMQQDITFLPISIIVTVPDGYIYIFFSSFCVTNIC